MQTMFGCASSTRSSISLFSALIEARAGFDALHLDQLDEQLGGYLVGVVCGRQAEHLEIDLARGDRRFGAGFALGLVRLAQLIDKFADQLDEGHPVRLYISPGLVCRRNPGALAATDSDGRITHIPKVRFA
jgi:hypothetical protein